MKPLLSIIIPCYKTATTLEETLISVLAQDFDAWEAILIDDGSPDDVASIANKWVRKDARFRYHKKENAGLGAARNTGIELAEGTFILPLDSDNKVRPQFAKKAIAILKEHPYVGVVYGNAMRFGIQTTEWNVGSFDTYKLLAHNYIDACAIIRKTVFETVGLYDIEMPYQGHEDWEFWLRVLKSDYAFNYLPEITFDYRVTEDSMIRRFTEKMLAANIAYVKNKHASLYFDAYDSLFKKYKKTRKRKPTGFLYRLKRKFTT